MNMDFRRKTSSVGFCLDLRYSSARPVREVETCILTRAGPDFPPSVSMTDLELDVWLLGRGQRWSDFWFFYPETEGSIDYSTITKFETVTSSL